MKKLVHVAVGVIVDAHGNILIARRAQAAHQGGLWEFPGGKVDVGETVQQALTRELQEELAINVVDSKPLIQIRHHYPDKSVLLDVHTVTHFTGVAKGNEGQPIDWVSIDNLNNYEFPAANRPIILALRLPKKLLITGSFSSLENFNQKLLSALQQGIQLVQLRLDNFDPHMHSDWVSNAMSLCLKHNAALVINTTLPLFQKTVQYFPYQKMGLHLNRHQLFLHDVRPVAANFLLSASCHDQREIEQAHKIGVDYLLLSPVLKTASHPDIAPLGWKGFASLTEHASVPVYALGGMDSSCLDTALFAGAQGIAGISCWWQ